MHVFRDLGYGPISHPANASIGQRAKTLSEVGLRLTHAYGRVYLDLLGKIADLAKPHEVRDVLTPV